MGFLRQNLLKTKEVDMWFFYLLGIIAVLIVFFNIVGDTIVF